MFPVIKISSYCLNCLDDDDDIHEQPEKYELNSHLRTLNAKLNDLNTCNDLIVKHGSTLQRSLSELEQLDNLTDVTAKIKSINERATVFRITTTAMLKVVSTFLCPHADDECF